LGFANLSGDDLEPLVMEDAVALPHPCQGSSNHSMHSAAVADLYPAGQRFVGRPGDMSKARQRKTPPKRGSGGEVNDYCCGCAGEARWPVVVSGAGGARFMAGAGVAVTAG